MDLPPVFYPPLISLDELDPQHDPQHDRFLHRSNHVGPAVQLFQFFSLPAFPEQEPVPYLTSARSAFLLFSLVAPPSFLMASLRPFLLSSQPPATDELGLDHHLDWSHALNDRCRKIPTH